MRTAVLAAAATLALPGIASAAAAFATPDRAAYCGISEGEPPLRLICWRPADGLTLDMTRLRRPGAHVVTANRRYRPAAPRALLFGRTWRLPGAWACTSRRTGLTCRNRAGHGWVLGRRSGRRLF